MACPHCGTPQTQDFGIVNCPSCGILLMIDMEGQAHIQGSQEPSSEDISLEGRGQDQHFEQPFQGELPTQPTESVYQDLISFEVNADNTPEVSLEAASVDDIKEIIDFANSDSVTGPLSYTLTIAGIDRADIKNKVLEVLSNPKLFLVPEELNKAVSNGKIEIEGLNAIKIGVIVMALQGLKVEISWSQYAY